MKKHDVYMMAPVGPTWPLVAQFYPTIQLTMMQLPVTKRMDAFFQVRAAAPIIRLKIDIGSVNTTNIRPTSAISSSTSMFNLRVKYFEWSVCKGNSSPTSRANPIATSL